MGAVGLNRSIEAEKDLGRDLEKYVGKWVAVCDHAIVAYADTPEALLEQEKGQKVERRFRVTSPGSGLL